MKKKGLTLGAIGFLLGALVGLSVVVVRQIVASQLIGILSEEVAASCDCEFVVDDVDVSLLALQVEAHNARIISDQRTRLSFKKVKLWLDLSQLTSRKILISELELEGGTSEGFLPGTPTFEFIDHLAAPLPPERDRPDRWRLQLVKLIVKPSFFIDTVAGAAVQSADASLELERTASDDFTLDARIASLQVVHPELDPMEFKGVTGSLYLEDDFVEFRNLHLQREGLRLNFDGVTQLKLGDLTQGYLEASIEPHKLIAHSPVQGSFNLECRVGGVLEAPTLEGEFGLQPNTALTLDRGTGAQVFIEQFESDFLVASAPHFSAKISTIEANGPLGALALTQPITITEGAIAGGIRIDVAQFSQGETSLSDSSFELKLGGTLGDPSVTIAGKSRSLQIGEREIGALEISAKANPRGVTGHILLLGDEGGIVSLQSRIELSGANAPSIEQASISASGFHITGVPFALSGEMVLEGAGGKHSPEGKGSFTLVPTTISSTFTMNVDAQLKSGVLTISGQDERQAIQVQSSINFRESGSFSLKAATKELQLAEYLGKNLCGALRIELQYEAALENIDTGNGTLRLPRATLGCERSMLELVTPFDGKIQNGVLGLRGIQLTGGGATMTLGGDIHLVDGLNIAVSGGMELSSLLPLLPRFDELQGSLQLDAQIKGPFADPSLYGEIVLSDGELTIAASDVALTGTSGKFLLAGQTVSVEPLHGLLNGGQLDVRGSISPFSTEFLAIDAQLKRVLLEPMPNGYVVTSGQLYLGVRPDGLLFLQGDLTIDSAEISQQVNLTTLLSEFTRKALQRDTTLRTTSSADVPLQLGIRVHASNNIFLATNFISGEFAGDVTVSGTPEKPILQGALEVLNGWIKIKDSYFDISSGTVRFSPGDPEPTLLLLAESYVATPSGDSLLVFLDVTGPVSAPRLAFSSDRALTQQQLLTLITESSGSFPQVFSGVRGGLGATNLSLFSRDSEFDLVNTLRRLTSIDAITIEPGFSDQSGLAGPRVVAEKVLTEDLSLVGESSLASTVQESRFRLNYDLTSALKVSGYVESSSTRQQTLPGIDFIYEALSRHVQVVGIRIEGARTFSEKRILEELKITSRSRIRLSDLDRLRIRLEEFYVSQGFFAATTALDCTAHRRSICRELQLKIDEGPRSTVVDVELATPSTAIPAIARALKEIKVDRTASERVRARAEQRVLRELRSDGYLAARVQALYIPAETGSDRVLRIEVHPGTPMSFIFSGNKSFKAEELLTTIDLFGRRIPFGSNTIRILVQNIERLYRQNGRLYVRIQESKEVVEAEQRVVYHLVIDEGPVVSVAGVRMSGSMPEQEGTGNFRALFSARFPDAVEDVFSPKFAVEEELEANARQMRVVLAESGYPQAQVTPIIEPDASNDRVYIDYHVELGTEDRASALLITGLPPGLNEPERPSQPYSIPKINRYVDDLQRALVERGYRSARLLSVLEPATGVLTLEASPGERTMVREIVVEGGGEEVERVVRATMQVKPGSVWDVKALQGDRERLLRLGLFSRVELEPSDGTIDSLQEDLVVYLERRNLQSLVVGGGAKSEFGVHFFAEASDRQLFMDGRSLSLRADLFLDPSNTDISEGTAGLQYSNPSLLGTQFVHTEDLRFQKLELPAYEYDLDRISLTSYGYRTFEGGTTLSFGHTLSFDNLTSVAPGAVLSPLDTGSSRLSYLAANVRYDKRDNALNPDRGYFLSIDGDVADGILGSDADYFRLQPKGSWLVPFNLSGRRFTFAALSHLGFGWEYGDTEEIPITERYYSGGRSTIRGFRESSLGPRGADGAVTGGDTMLVSTLELRYRPLDTLSVHTFFDFGSVFLREESIDRHDIRESAGVGLRFLSPIGPLGFDVGHPLDERPGEPSIRFHFTIGSNF